MNRKIDYFEVTITLSAIQYKLNQLKKIAAIDNEAISDNITKAQRHLEEVLEQLSRSPKKVWGEQ